MNIRKASHKDLPEIMSIYEKARAFMRDNGNPTQWGAGRPARSVIENDIANGNFYVCEKISECICENICDDSRDDSLVVFDDDRRNDNRSGSTIGINKGGSKIIGVFALIIGEDPTYLEIQDGSWRSDETYGTIHRLASDGITKGIARACFDFCHDRCHYLRIDTHKDNLPMQAAIKKYGFVYCGIIHVADGSERVAFDYLGHPSQKRLCPNQGHSRQRNRKECCLHPHAL